MAQPGSKTIVRMWNKDGYHKDVLLIDHQQVRMSEGRVKESSGSMMFASNPGSPRMVIDPASFPEAVCFEIIVVEYVR